MFEQKCKNPIDLLKAFHPSIASTVDWIPVFASPGRPRVDRTSARLDSDSVPFGPPDLLDSACRVKLRYLSPRPTLHCTPSRTLAEQLPCASLEHIHTGQLPPSRVSFPQHLPIDEKIAMLQFRLANRARSPPQAPSTPAVLGSILEGAQSVIDLAEVRICELLSKSRLRS